MKPRAVVTAVSALALAVLVGLAFVLVVDRGPDPDDPGYTTGRTSWQKSFSVSGDRVLEAFDDLPPGTCFRWAVSGTLRADVSWRGSDADARVELENPRLTEVSTRGRLLDGCDDDQPTTETGLYDVVSAIEIGGAGSTTCDWTFSAGSPSEVLGRCGGEEATSSRVRERVTVDTQLGTRWGFELGGDPLRRWQGSASADGDGDDGFSSPLCFSLKPVWTFFVQREDAGSVTTFDSPRERACVDLWEPTPWGDAST